MRISNSLIVLFLIIFLTATSASAFLIRYDGPYEGRIVDAETGEPIEGVVVLGVWYEERPNVAGSNSTYYDAKETITDKKGEFKIQGQGLKMFSYVGAMNVLIFKVGYEYIGFGPWESLKWDGGLLLNKVNFEGNKAIIPFKKLTMEDRKKDSTPSRPNIPDEKMRLLTGEINKERIAIGLKPFTVER